MMRSRRDLRQNADIWPGFVDALATLLLVVIFLLVVFVLAQFFLNQLLQGKDNRLNSLEQAIAELTSQLDLEQATTAELRLSITQLSSDLQAAVADRDDAAAQLAEVAADRDESRDRILMLEDEQALLQQTLAALRQDAARAGELETELARTTDLGAKLQAELDLARQTVAADKETIELQLAQLIQLQRDLEALETTRADLELEVAEMAALLQAAATAKAGAAAEIARLADLLAAAQAAASALEIEAADLRQSVTSAEAGGRDLEAEVARLTGLLGSLRQEKAANDQQLAELTSALSTAQGSLESTRQELAGERSQRADLDQELTRLGALLATNQTEREVREQRLAQLDAELQDSRAQSSERERRIAELAAQLTEARAADSSDAATTEELRQAREQLLLELGQVRDRSSQLEAELAAAGERTMLTQRQLDERNLEVADLLRNAGRTDEALATEQALSREALNQVELLNRQINALRVQLAGLEQTLEAEQQKVDEQRVTIADLGSKLNMALANKVEELSRFRSEFFGRLSQVLGDRDDVRIVGDRFVFQSEVLFAAASAEIERGGMDDLRSLAESLLIIAAEIPPDVPWVLQINGHTDRRRIRTPEFPSNWELSTARAINVGQFLIDQGIPPERIAVAGFAQYQPVDDGADEIAYRRNRRIEIKLTTP